MSNPNYSAWDKLKLEDAKRLAKLQLDYCNSINAPCFVLDTGLCPFCARNALDGLTEHDVTTTVITRCELCQRSFID
jgi:hypothetical protein